MYLVYYLLGKYFWVRPIIRLAAPTGTHDFNPQFKSTCAHPTSFRRGYIEELFSSTDGNSTSIDDDTSSDAPDSSGRNNINIQDTKAITGIEPESQEENTVENTGTT